MPCFRLNKQMTFTRHAPGLLMTGMLLTAAAAMLALGAQAQTSGPTATAPAQTESPAQANPPAPAAVAAVPKYATSEIARAFGFIDANRDGKVSREEAAGFRGVARHFDEADTNKDGALSREEFESALTKGKSR